MTDTQDTPVREAASAGPPGGPTPSWRPILGAAAGLIALLTLLITAFAWPASETGPRDLPIAVAAPDAAAAGVQQQLGADGDLELLPVPDRDAAVAAIEAREAYGAVVIGPQGPEVLVASAASVPVAQMLTAQAGQMDAPVTDVVPTAAGDPRGSVLAAGSLPLVIGGIMTGAACSLVLRRTRDRLLTATVVAGGAGLVMAGVLQGWLDALEGDYLGNAGIIALGLLAVAWPLIGLRHLIGPAGIGVVALLVLLVGNPLSGLTSAPDLVPLGWLGQLLPPGAVGTALRGNAFFDGAGTATPLLVLACWAGVGLLMALVPHRERGATAPSQ